ncbi:MAG: hypothetical protein COV43_04285 [Deltaproteobacteria bacterium CG11_big_fil_rev_8_21_14_0_20_42_23]|nr:MAG: hypothetical protein COV43_04285 [Deltaproteobacteria bacterium CG11_big_fil_rev_8_21_14_0_20_42_23]PJC64994.1 MAG: hypothetical protein CO021_00675 [Deltaproteobacteria bacterium CG_4_9_14_0_2_um_filter_42_21]
MKKNVSLTLALFLFGSLMFSCEKSTGSSLLNPNDPSQQKAGGEEGVDVPSDLSGISLATVSIKTADETISVTVEVAKTPEQRAQGLMNREALPQQNGMWFVFDQEVEDSFWMKDTFIPLDIIFVGKDLKVVSIIENTVPESTELLHSAKPYKYVLEVNAGFVKQHKIEVGDEMEYRFGPAES